MSTYTNRNTLTYFINNNSSLINIIKKVFYLKRYRNTLFDELALRFMFLIGKL